MPVLAPPEGGLAGNFSSHRVLAAPQALRSADKEETSDVHQKAGPALMGSLQGSFQPWPERMED